MSKKPLNPVAAFCVEQKIGPSELSKRVGVSRQLAKMWIDGDCKPGAKYLWKLAEIIGADPKEMNEAFRNEQLHN